MIILSCVIMMMNKRQGEGEWWLDDNNNRNPRMKIRQKTYFETTYIFCCLISVQHGDALFGCRDVIWKSLSCKLPLLQTTTLIYIMLGSQLNQEDIYIKFNIRCLGFIYRFSQSNKCTFRNNPMYKTGIVVTHSNGGNYKKKFNPSRKALTVIHNGYLRSFWVNLYKIDQLWT